MDDQPRPAATSPDDYTLTIEDAVALYERAGLPRIARRPTPITDRENRGADPSHPRSARPQRVSDRLCRRQPATHPAQTNRKGLTAAPLLDKNTPASRTPQAGDIIGFRMRRIASACQAGSELGIPHSTFYPHDWRCSQDGMSDVPQCLDIAAPHAIVCHAINAKSWMLLDLFMLANEQR